MEMEITSSGPDDTREAAASLVRRYGGRVVIALHGELGSGKTCFVQGLAEELGVARPVTSPSFVLVNEYSGRRRLIHMDLYRIGSAEEAAGLGFEEYLEADAVIAVEWAERAADLIPPGAVHVHIQATSAPDERKIRIEAGSDSDRIRQRAVNKRLVEE